MLDALIIWDKLTKQNLRVTEKEYAAMMKCATHTGDSLVMERVMTDLAEDVLVPSKETVATILEWFEFMVVALFTYTCCRRKVLGCHYEDANAERCPISAVDAKTETDDSVGHSECIEMEPNSVCTDPCPTVKEPPVTVNVLAV